jgi:NAD(P)-binding Rossmann-like domain
MLTTAIPNAIGRYPCRPRQALQATSAMCHSKLDHTKIETPPPHNGQHITSAESDTHWIPRTVVIGGGIGGLMTAYVASKSSREVIILESDPTDLTMQLLDPVSNELRWCLQRS